MIPVGVATLILYPGYLARYNSANNLAFFRITMLNFLRDLRHHVKVSLMGAVSVLITELLDRSRDYGVTRP